MAQPLRYSSSICVTRLLPASQIWTYCPTRRGIHSPGQLRRIGHCNYISLPLTTANGSAATRSGFSMNAPGGCLNGQHALPGILCTMFYAEARLLASLHPRPLVATAPMVSPVPFLTAWAHIGVSDTRDASLNRTPCGSPPGPRSQQPAWPPPPAFPPQPTLAGFTRLPRLGPRESTDVNPA